MRRSHPPSRAARLRGLGGLRGSVAAVLALAALGPAPAGAGTVVGDGPPTVTVGAGALNRELRAHAVPAGSDAIAACAIAARPSGSAGGFEPLATRVDAGTGICDARLDTARFPGPAAYEVMATASDDDGEPAASAPAQVTVAVPSVAPPALTGRVLSAAVTPVAGIPVTSCAFRLAPPGGSATAVLGSLSALSGSCTGEVPSGVPDGTYELTAEAIDANGDRGESAAGAPVLVMGGSPLSGGPDPATGPPADPFTGGGVTELLLACGGELVLTDVRAQGRRVVLAGVAAPRLVGQRVVLTLLPAGRVVARPLVARAGTFRAVVALPSARRSVLNRARYRASAPAARSTAISLVRRMPGASVSVRSGWVTFRGVVTAPRAPALRDVRLVRLVACGRWETVATARRSAAGAYRFRVRLPRGVRAALYRADTRVPTLPNGGRVQRTYTLPRGAAAG